MNKQHLIDKGIDVSHWRASSEYDEVESMIFGDVVGMVYDTSKWPVPDDTYHADNWAFWHRDDPNRPESEEEDAAFERDLNAKEKFVGGSPAYQARQAHLNRDQQASS